MDSESIEGGELAVKDQDLIKAAHRGYLEAVRTLVFVDGANVNASRDEKNGGSTPLVNASQNGHLEIVKFLVGRGAEVDKPIKEGITALMVACQNGHSLVAQFLIEHGADVLTMSSVRGLTAIFLAVERGHTDVAHLLIAADANVNVARADNGDRPMIAAAKRGNVEIIVALIAADAKINVHRTDHGATPLMAASMNGHLPAVRTLLAAEADPNAKSTVDGTTSVFMAAQNGHVEILRELVRWGADVNLVTKDDRSSPLTQAVWKGNEECVKVLLANGAHINHRMVNGASSLIVAAEQGYHKIVSELLCMDEDIITFALKDNYREEVKRYIAQRDHTEYRKDKFRSWGVLKRAVRDKSVETGILALEKAQVNLSRHDNGNTALIAAARAGHVKIVKMLLSNHADVNARNLAGFTALYEASIQHHQADSGGRRKIIQALLSAGADENILVDYEHSSPRLSTDPLPHKGKQAWALVRDKLTQQGAKSFEDPLDMSPQWGRLQGAVHGHRRFARLQMDAKAEWAMLKAAVHDPAVDKQALSHVTGKDAWQALRRNVMVKGAYSAEAQEVDRRHEAEIKVKAKAPEEEEEEEEEKVRHEPKHEWGILRNAVHEMHQRKHHEKEVLRHAQYRYELSKEVAMAGKKRAELERDPSLGLMQKAVKYKLPAFLWAKLQQQPQQPQGQASKQPLEPKREEEGEGLKTAEETQGADIDANTRADADGPMPAKTEEAEGDNEGDNEKKAEEEGGEENGDDQERRGDTAEANEREEGDEEEEEEEEKDLIGGNNAGSEAGAMEKEEEEGGKDQEKRDAEAAPLNPTPPVEEKPSKNKGGFFGRMFK